MRLTVLFTPVMPSFGKVYIMGVNWHERSVVSPFSGVRACGPEQWRADHVRGRQNFREILRRAALLQVKTTERLNPASQITHQIALQSGADSACAVPTVLGSNTHFAKTSIIEPW